MKEGNQADIERNLLIIDDEVEITKTLYRQFRQKYNVFLSTNGMDAIPIMEKENIQVVLSDQRMPEMTGVDFFTRIKDKYPDALKLILTGYSDIEAVIGAINEGQVFRYITKPWNPVELATAIEEAFEKHELITNNKKLVRKLHEVNTSLEKKVRERTLELEQTNSKLKNLNLEKNQYIGIVAHDLRSPIGNALNFTNLLLSKFHVLSEEKHLNFLNIISERCSYSLSLMEDFLDVSKIEAGILDLNLKEYNYCQIVSDCITQNLDFAQNKSQVIHFNCMDEELIVHLDKHKIEQVLTNLISNAIKYSDKGKQIWIEVNVADNQFITKVTDEGQGIPENELDGIFNHFQTSSVKATNKEKSTGLGLAIAKKIVESHNGKIEVKSKSGSGSEFYFSLPLQ